MSYGDACFPLYQNALVLTNESNDECNVENQSVLTKIIFIAKKSYLVLQCYLVSHALLFKLFIAFNQHLVIQYLCVIIV